MSRSKSVSRAGSQLRALSGPIASSASRPLSLYHHPAVALSLVLIAASASQIAVVLVHARLLSGRHAPTSGPAVHGYLLEGIEAVLRAHAAPERVETLLFIACSMASLLSSAGWYAVARAGIGPAWALWTGLLWAAHPAFAFLVQRPGPLALLILVTPITLALLVWWRRSQRPIIAGLAGMALGLMSLIGVQGLLLLPVCLAGVWAAGVPQRGRLVAAAFMVAGFALAGGLGGSAFCPPGGARAFIGQINRDMRQSMDDSAAPIAQAARGSDPGTPIGRVLVRHLVTSPAATTEWLARRLARGFYATADEKLQRPLFVMQLVTLLPALWGGVVALRHRDWRWTAGLGLGFMLAFWFSAGLMHPLARNLVPAGGVVVLAALIGLADLYERLFGRRLTESRAPSPDMAERP